MLASVIVGGGPGGLGPLIAAAQAGLLPDWLGQGVAIVDRQRELGGTLGRYAINSDSLGGAYLEFLDAAGTPGELKQLRRDPVTRQMAEYEDGYPPLELVDRFLRRRGEAVEAMITAHAACAFWKGTRARFLRLREDGSLELHVINLDGSATVLVARTAVIALGGRQHWTRQHLLGDLTLMDFRLKRLMPSDRLLSHVGLGEAAAHLSGDEGRPIVIVGGSHSAYSAAWTLTNLLPKHALGSRRILILQRRPPRIFYPSAAEAEADDYPFAAQDICPRTQRVNRLSGLRSDGRVLWRRMASRPDVSAETQVAAQRLDQLTISQLTRLLEDAALVVPAFGYRSATLPIFDTAGRRLHLSADAGGCNVAQDCRLLLTDGSTLPNVFGIGLGAGFRPYGPMGGEPSFTGQANSLWLYQNGIGAIVHRGILDVLSDRSASAPTRTTSVADRQPAGVEGCAPPLPRALTA